ncbi:GIY-YIG nuclease family protein [Asaia bogorensis]|uniref:GIY-YIG nuclease family protein n=1 Tax=Asaia bogorensis TaxID=91915 RepID=UPI000EFCFADA|nr:GIY-YIG nuclease family protein [Asaia bogorensis]
MSFVYIVRAGADGPVKIGFTTSPTTRFSAIGTSNAAGLSLLRLIEGSRATERWFHQAFDHQHIRGEWFSFDADMLTAIPDAKQDEDPEVSLEHEAAKLEAQEIVKAAGDSAPEGSLTGKKITHAAQRLGIRRGHVKRLWYKEQKVIAAAELDFLRRVHVDLLAEVREEAERKAAWVDEKLGRIRRIRSSHYTPAPRSDTFDLFSALEHEELQK